MRVRHVVRDIVRSAITCVLSQVEHVPVWSAEHRAMRHVSRCRGDRADMPAAAAAAEPDVRVHGEQLHDQVH
jgi:hypothetical protein